jgi:hypothetical protein
MCASSRWVEERTGRPARDPRDSSSSLSFVEAARGLHDETPALESCCDYPRLTHSWPFHALMPILPAARPAFSRYAHWVLSRMP